MTWLTDLRKRKIKFAGFVEVWLPEEEKPIRIPLNYPRGKDKAFVIEKIAELEKRRNSKGKDRIDHIEANEIAMRESVRRCLRIEEGAEEPTDEEIDILIKESGGEGGALVKRCARLLGLGGAIDRGRG